MQKNPAILRVRNQLKRDSSTSTNDSEHSFSHDTSAKKSQFYDKGLEAFLEVLA